MLRSTTWINLQELDLSYTLCTETNVGKHAWHVYAFNGNILLIILVSRNGGLT